MTTKGIIVIGTDLLETTTRRTGPNDAKHVVWAIIKSFLLLFVLYI